MKPIRLLPDCVSAFRDRHGKVRLRYRRTGQKTHYFKGALGSPEFEKELAKCREGTPLSVGAKRVVTGSIADLITRYYRSSSFKAGSAITQHKNRGILEMFRNDYGDDLVTALRYEHVDAILAAKAEKFPAAARNLRKQLRRLFDHAVRLEWRKDNPVAGVTLAKNKSTGHHTWSEEEIAQYQARHPLGTKARLAMELMLWTGNRRGDAVRLGPQHVRTGRLEFVQEKTGKPMKIAIAPDLAAAIVAMPVSGHLAFLVTDYGRPFTPAGFGGRFRSWCDQADLPHCSAHGLRKAISRRMAESGAGNQGIKAVTGHSGDSEVAHYTRGADQMALADQGIAALARWVLANRSRSGLANHRQVIEKEQGNG